LHHEVTKGTKSTKFLIKSLVAFVALRVFVITRRDNRSKNMIVYMRQSAFALFASFLLVSQSQPRPAQPVAALSPFIDVHAHLEAETADVSIQAARQAMKSENAAKILFLPAPYTAGDTGRVDSDVIAAAERSRRVRSRFSAAAAR